MASPLDTEVKKSTTESRPVDEPHLRNLPRQAKMERDTKRRGPGGATGPTMVPVDLVSPTPEDTGTKTPARPTPTDSVVHPTGIVHVSGLKLRFPLGTSIKPGELVVVGHKPFEVRKETLLTPMGIMKGVLFLAVAVLAVIGIASLVTSPSGGSVSGVVVDRSTGRIITNASVEFEGGPTVVTNTAGLYNAEGLRAGMFKITASAPGFETRTGTVTRPADAGAQLAFALMPLGYSGTVESGPTPVMADTQSPEPPLADETAVAFGNITVETDFGDYLVFVDGVLYGKEAKKIKRMSEGDHRVVLQLEGFEDFSKDVSVKAKTTHTLSVAKTDLTPRVDPVKRAKAYFAEAKSFLDRGLFPQAIEKYNMGLQDDPRNAEGIQYRGWAQFKSGNVEGARADFVKAASIHEESGRYLDAVACAGHLIELDPQSSAAYLRRARYYTALRESGKAIEDCEVAVRKDKKSGAAQVALAEACFTAGEYKRAAKEFDKARKLSDKPDDMYVRLLIALAHDGDDDQLRKKFKDFSSSVSAEKQRSLRGDPEWLRVLQIVDPKKRSEG